MKFLCLPLLLLPGLFSSVMAQESAVRVTGVVVDWQYARVITTRLVFKSEELTKEVRVDDEGAYKVELPPGQYVVKAIAPGFRERRVKLRLEPAAPRILNLMLPVEPQIFRCPKGAICL